MVIRAEGFLPLHTRAYTFESNKVVARLTAVTEKHTLFGYKHVPDGGAEGGAGADGGVLLGSRPADAGAPVMLPAPAPAPMGPALPPPPGITP